MASLYSGSRILTPVGDVFGLPIDQVNFLACQFIGLGLAYGFRKVLSPNHVSATTRHVFETSVGITLIVFCFGNQLVYILGQAVACFVMMHTLPQALMPKAVFLGSMTLLCVCHIWRQLYDYGGYTMDITGPLMINTQRMTSLAWAVFDGQQKETELSTHQKRYAVRKFPTLLEFLSYTFNFHGAMVGPFCFYVDYVDFIEGKNLVRHTVANGVTSGSHAAVHRPECPSPFYIVVRKVAAFFICVFIVIFIIPIFPISYISDPVFLQSNFVMKFMYLIVCTTVIRPKYYLAWTLAEAVNNNAGLGFYYDKDGEQRWDAVDNSHIGKVELSTSIKMLVDNWNISTTWWLRHIVYERMKRGNTFAVFVVSSLWHGFYPGYYSTFLTAALLVPAARSVRRNWRPWFQETPERVKVYTVLTFLTTRLTIAYMTFPFISLEFERCYEVYKSLYFCIHLVGIVVIMFYALRPRSGTKWVKKES